MNDGVPVTAPYSTIGAEMAALTKQVEQTQAPARQFKELVYETKKTWSRERRVVAMVERLVGKENSRFVMTSLPAEEHDAKSLYCARGDMENRIKEQQLGLFADRTSAHTMRANQLRLWLSSLAYILVNELRRVGLRDTSMARAQGWTIRTMLLKIGELFSATGTSHTCRAEQRSPPADLFAPVHANIQASFPAVF